MRKPYFWKARAAWYVKSDDGRRIIYLADDEAAAYETWREIRAAAHPENRNARVDVVIEAFLRAAQGRVNAGQIAPKTYRGYLDFLVSFCAMHGTRAVRSLIPHDVTGWLAKHKTWGNGGQRGAIAAVKIALNWAVDEGLLETNPLARVKRPKAKRREKLIDDTEHAAMMMHAGGGKRRAGVFRAALIGLKHSGGRPGTIAAIKVGDVSRSLDTWVLQQHKTRAKTEAPLVIYLSPCLQTLTRILLQSDRQASEPLFRNSLGEQWTANAIRCRMRQLRAALKLDPGIVAYSYRHTFATKAIVRGVDVASVAELLGHRDVSMIQKHYGHLAKESEHLKRAARKAIHDSRDLPS